MSALPNMGSLTWVVRNGEAKRSLNSCTVMASEFTIHRLEAIHNSTHYCISSFSLLSKLSCPKFKRWTLHPLHGNCSILSIFLLHLSLSLSNSTIRLQRWAILKFMKYPNTSTQSTMMLSALFSVTSSKVTSTLFALLMNFQLMFSGDTMTAQLHSWAVIS